MSATTIVINISEFSILIKQFMHFKLWNLWFLLSGCVVWSLECAACDRYATHCHVLSRFTFIDKDYENNIGRVGARCTGSSTVSFTYIEKPSVLEMNETLPGAMNIELNFLQHFYWDITIRDISGWKLIFYSCHSTFRASSNGTTCLESTFFTNIVDCRLSIFMNKLYVGTYCVPNVDPFDK